jgi:glucokinase
LYLGIEIGGTKLQMGVGAGRGEPLAELARLDVDPRQAAQGIRRQIAEHGRRLVERYPVRAVGIGFGGPVDSERGRTLVSNQVEGWKDFDLVLWCRETLARPTLLANDSDSAGVAEARFGAGKGRSVVFYTNVGSGIGGALVLDGRLYRGGSGVASEIGHLRPCPDAGEPGPDVEALASGWAITAAVREELRGCPETGTGTLHLVVDGESTPNIREPVPISGQPRSETRPTEQAPAADLLRRCGGRIGRLSTQGIAEAAAEGNPIACRAFDRACRVYGWAVAQMVTLLAPNVVVAGGGVSLAGEGLWLAPLRRHVDRYVFPPLRGSFTIEAARLGEEVVVHGVLALAREQFPDE